MTPFEKWWATTAFTEMDGPVPPAVARLAWDAATSYATRQLNKLFIESSNKETQDEQT